MKGYAPKWGTRHSIAVEKSLKTKAEPLTVFEAIMKI